jgi:predicted secreted acid phosphatase
VSAGLIRGGRRLFLAAGVLALVAALPAREPANLSALKAEITRYVRSGEYERDVEAVAQAADRWVAARAKERQAGERLAVVFDVDETLLSNWPLMHRLDLGYVPAEWTRWVDAAAAPAIEPVRRLFRAVRARGVDVIVITGRTERDRAGTERNLRAIGCGDYATLVCMADGAQATTAAFKTAARRRLAEEGWVLIANLGDQESDLVGGYAEKTFKLPGPFYLTD